jgi:hypothetical protein
LQEEEDRFKEKISLFDTALAQALKESLFIKEADTLQKMFVRNLTQKLRSLI